MLWPRVCAILRMCVRNSVLAVAHGGCISALAFRHLRSEIARVLRVACILQALPLMDAPCNGLSFDLRFAGGTLSAGGGGERLAIGWR
eukprot:11809439-Alexandrium_andersonii.AAC.1